MSIFKRFREHVRWSQADLAARLGLSGQSTVGNYERGDRLPEIDVAYRFLDLARAHGFQATLEDIYPRAPDREDAA